ncbi:hypothetical protein AGMMS49543_20820 [Betaproteobacteria bacterium]|nr:hypothetical protein AGMMS49543_20820 [Betaproteobacteria bacterium]
MRPFILEKMPREETVFKPYRDWLGVVLQKVLIDAYIDEHIDSRDYSMLDITTRPLLSCPRKGFYWKKEGEGK